LEKERGLFCLRGSSRLHTLLWLSKRSFLISFFTGRGEDEIPAAGKNKSIKNPQMRVPFLRFCKIYVQHLAQ
jgi:hypothetical protein